MKDEIKEILDELKAIVECKDYENGLVYIEHSYLKAIYYHITNLQEELDRCVKANVILDDENAELQGKITDLQEENKRLKEIEKLIKLFCKLTNCNINQLKPTRENIEKCLNTIKDVETMKNWLKESNKDEQIKNDN